MVEVSGAPTAPTAISSGADPMLPGHVLTRLLDATSAVGSDLDLPTVLRQVVESAMTLVHAKSGALGVVDVDGDGDALSQLVTVGSVSSVSSVSSDRERAAGTSPGALGHPSAPLRLRDLESAVALGLGAVDAPTGAVLGVPVRVGGTVFGHLRLSDKLDGRDFTDGDEQVLVMLAVAAGVAIRNARLYEQARRGSAWREAGRTISTALLSDAAREDVITLLVETAGGVLSADSMLIALTDGAGPHVAATSGAPGPALDAALLDGLRPVLRDGQPAAAVSSGLQGFTVPLGPAGASCPGVMVALWASPPSPLLVEDLKGFAAQAAVALELADRRLEAEQGAVLADRDRIGRDLHDMVIQRLFATGMRLQGAVRLIDDDPDRARARVDLAVDDHDLWAPRADGRAALPARPAAGARRRRHRAPRFRPRHAPGRPARHGRARCGR